MKKKLIPSVFINKRFKLFEFNKIFNLDLNDIMILSSSVHSFKDISKLIPKINLSKGLDVRRKMIKLINLPNKFKKPCI